MSAYNVVRFRVKPGMQEAFEEAHRIEPGFEGFYGGALVKTGDDSYCFVGCWESLEGLAAGRSRMIAILEGCRHMLQDLGEGRGLMDAVSGEAVVEFHASAE